MALDDTTIVFVPGAWHKAACFDPLRAALHARGWQTAAVEYPSVGAEPPNKELADDTAAVRAVIEPLVEQGRKVVVLTHSYGGVPGANAVETLGWADRAAASEDASKSGGVTQFIYLSAFVTPKGKSLLDLLGGQYLPWMLVDGDYVRVDDPVKHFYHDVEDTATALKNVDHESRLVYEQPALYEPWHTIPVSFFVCEEDQAIPLPIQEQLVSALGPDAYVTRFASSHSPFVSRVPEVVTAIEHAAQIGHDKATGKK